MPLPQQLHPLAMERTLKDEKRKERRKEETTPFGITLMRSLVIYQAAQSPVVIQMI